MNITVMLIILIIFIIIFWIIGTINKINRLEVKISEANSSIDIALTKRYDVLTKMIATVKGYTHHEENTMFELKKDFADYMGNIAYDWDDQVEMCNKWYEENIKNLVENSSPEENNIPVQGHRRGSSR